MAYTKTNWQNLPSTTTPLNATDLNKIEQGIYDAPLEAHPVGSVFITSTNTNPSSTLGGTWTLINKVFESLTSSSSDLFARNTSNTSSVTVYMARNGQSIELYLNVTTSVAIGETSVTLGTVDFSKLGITRLLHSMTDVPGGSDTGDGIPLMNLNYETGVLTTTDAIGKTSGSIASGSNLRVQFNIVCPMSYMSDTDCNQFIWKRTA